MTEKDLRDLDWTAENPVEFVGLSFVRSADDVRWLRRELKAREIDPWIVAKIEKPEAVAAFDAILAEADAVMVARGDLGVEMDVARVPAIQKRIIAACPACPGAGHHGHPDARQHGAAPAAPPGPRPPTCSTPCSTAPTP